MQNDGLGNTTNGPTSLTAGTSGLQAHTRAHRSQSEATDSEAASAPASKWWLQPVFRDRKRSQGSRVQTEKGRERRRSQVKGG